MSIRPRRCGALVLAVWLALTPGLAAAQPDRAAEKAARRQQQQLQALQQQASQAQAGQERAEQERAALVQQLRGREQSAARSQAALRAAEAGLKDAEAVRAQLAARVDALEKSLEAQREASQQALSAKDRELARAARALEGREAERAQWQARFGEQARLVGECGNRNDRLFRLNAELIDRYRDKGVIDALRQREPVLGLSDVQMFNLVQEYRDKAQTERYTPAAQTR
jgi:chromosome segregation ATPase